MRLFQDDPWPFKVRLVVWDSMGNAEWARVGMQTLAEEKHVRAVIGPLLSRTAAAVASEAERWNIPVMTLSTVRGMGHGGTVLFHNSVSHRAMVATVAEYSVEELGILAYAVLYPRNAYGQMYRRLFEEEVIWRGGEVVAVASYSDEQVDFGDIIKTMVPFKVPEATESTASGESVDRDPVPIINFEAIFIPDDAETVRLLVPQLAYYDITGVQLLGTSGWNTRSLIEDGGKFVEGAIFVDGFFESSPLPEVQAFVEDFTSTFGTNPSLIEALSFDATSVILKRFQKNGGYYSSAMLRQSLMSIDSYRGVSGLSGFGPDGEGLRRYFLLTVGGGEIRQIIK
jgi:ABC-type branched-subunit amino acid transport system substrate-binding protein